MAMFFIRLAVHGDSRRVVLGEGYETRTRHQWSPERKMADDWTKSSFQGRIYVQFMLVLTLAADVPGTNTTRARFRARNKARVAPWTGS